MTARGRRRKPLGIRRADPKPIVLCSHRATRLTLSTWTDTVHGSIFKPGGQLNFTWNATSSCHRNATVKWTGETCFFEQGAYIASQSRLPTTLSISHVAMAREDLIAPRRQQYEHNIRGSFRPMGYAKCCYQARNEWTTSCDAALVMLVRYVSATVDWVLIGYIGDGPSALSLQL